MNFFSYSFPSQWVRLNQFTWRPYIFFKRIPLIWQAHKDQVNTFRNPYDISLLQLAKPEGILYWAGRTDKDRGGTSWITHEYNEQEACMEVKGTVSTECVDKMTDDPWAGVVCDVWPTLKCYELNVIRIQFKGDGNTYKFHLDISNSAGPGLIATVILLNLKSISPTLSIKQKNGKLWKSQFQT